MDVDFMTVDGLRIRCARSDAAHEPSVLLTGPWPESLYAFTPIWESLAGRARLLAVDLPGFGLSERREDLLSPSAMGGFLARLILECDLGTPHVVAPDVGTPAVLFAASSHPELIASMVVGSGGVATPIELGEPLRSWALDPDTARFRAMDSHAVIDASMATIGGPGVPVEIQRDYQESYAGDRFFESMRFVRHYPEDLPELARRLPSIETPALVIAGRHDRVVPLVNATFLGERLPHARVEVLETGHFVWEEAPVEYARLVGDWVTGASAAVTGGARTD